MDPKKPEPEENVIGDLKKIDVILQAKKQQNRERVLTYIKDYCEKNGCVLIATAVLDKNKDGHFVIKAFPGVESL